MVFGALTLATSSTVPGPSVSSSLQTSPHLATLQYSNISQFGRRKITTLFSNYVTNQTDLYRFPGISYLSEESLEHHAININIYITCILEGRRQNPVERENVRRIAVTIFIYKQPI